MVTKDEPVTFELLNAIVIEQMITYLMVSNMVQCDRWKENNAVCISP